MSDDIVSRLEMDIGFISRSKRRPLHVIGQDCREAAETITSLRRELAEARHSSAQHFDKWTAVLIERDEAREKAASIADRKAAKIRALRNAGAAIIASILSETADEIRALKQPEEGDGG